MKKEKYHIEYKNGHETTIRAIDIKEAIILAMNEAIMKGTRPDIRKITTDYEVFTDIEIKYRTTSKSET